jgi:hypothetical protein
LLILLNYYLFEPSGEEIRAVVVGIGLNSQWGKIKANLVSEAVNTPLQDKLEDMAEKVGWTETAHRSSSIL